MEEPFRGLYIHIPFCARRCAYCDFTTSAVPFESTRIDDYIDNLVLSIELAARGGLLGGIRTIYIGGGTPSFIGTQRLEKLFGAVQEAVDLSQVEEYTMEANPDSFTVQVADLAKRMGVTRFSIGVQSTDDDTLKLLGRIHDSDQAVEALRIATAHSTNVSADLICGIMGERRGKLLHSVLEVTRLGVKHISVYPLTVEQGTPLMEAVMSGELDDIDEDEQADAMEAVQEALVEMGPFVYQRYEVSNYAMPGYYSRHNASYWYGIPYLGLGVGASSMFYAFDEDAVNASNALGIWGWRSGGTRRSAYESLVMGSTMRIRVTTGADSASLVPTANECIEDRLTQPETAAEDFMLSMRTVWGVDARNLKVLCEANPALREAEKEILDKGLARWEMNHLIPTRRGWLMGNELYGAIWARSGSSDPSF